MTYSTTGGVSPLFGSPDREAHPLGTVAGSLPGGFEGEMGSYLKVTTREGEVTKKTYMTLASTMIPESIGFIPLLTCHDVSHRSLVDRTVDAGGIFEQGRKMEFESVKLGNRFLIGVNQSQDERWVHRLFSPTFVEFLAEKAPEGAYFELGDGRLAVGSTSEPDKAALTALSEFGAKVAERLRSEALEHEGLGERSWLTASPASKDAERVREHEELLARVQSDVLPANIAAAGRRFRGRIRRMPVVWTSSLLSPCLFAGIFVLIPAFIALLFAPARIVAPVAAGAYALLVFLLTLRLGRAQIKMRCAQLGFESFARAYARDRGLVLSDGRSFHTSHVRVALPGTVQQVMSGDLPGSNINGSLLVCKQAANRRQPFEYSLSVFDGNELVATRPETPIEDWSAETFDGICREAASKPASDAAAK